MPELEEPLCSLLQTILTLLQSITAHASGAYQPNAKPIHTIRDMACGGSCSPMWSVHPLSRNGLSNSPTVGRSQRKSLQSKLSPTKRYLFVPTRKDLETNTGPCLHLL